MAAIVEKYNLWIISDEIHCDLLRQGQRHIPMAKIMPGYDKLIACTSASKCFNMAGMMFAEIFIRDEVLRDWYITYTNSYAMNVNPLSIAAHEAAYRHGYEWLDQLKTYLDKNFALSRKRWTKNCRKRILKFPKRRTSPGST